MSLKEKVNAQFAQIENLIVEEVKNGVKVEGSMFGITIDEVFISSTGSLIFEIKTPELRQIIADAELKRLESDVEFYREKLAEAEELLAQTKGLSK